MSRIVVIGATGHVGTYLVPRLVRAGHEVVALSRGAREPYLPAPEWRRVERVAADREAEDAAGTFGERIAALAPDAVVDMLCFTPESARQLVDALRPTRPLLLHCGRSGCTARSRGCRSPRTSRAPPTASTGPARRRSRRCCTARRSPAACRAWCCIPGTSAVRGRRSRRRATSISTSGGAWPPASRSPCPTSGSACCTTCTPTMSRRPSSGRSPGRPPIGSSFHVVSEQAMTLRGLAAGVAGWFGREPVHRVRRLGGVRAPRRRRARRGHPRARRPQHRREHRPRPRRPRLPAAVQLTRRPARVTPLARANGHVDVGDS